MAPCNGHMDATDIRTEKVGIVSVNPAKAVRECINTECIHTECINQSFVWI
jgi:hypothetical protein